MVIWKWGRESVTRCVCSDDDAGENGDASRFPIWEPITNGLGDEGTKLFSHLGMGFDEKSTTCSAWQPRMFSGISGMSEKENHYLLVESIVRIPLNVR